MFFRLKKIIAVCLCIGLLLSNSLYAIEVRYSVLNSTVITFSNDCIYSDGKYDGYSIKDNNLEIKNSGVYVIKGECDNGTISVKKDVSDVVLVLDNLSLTSKNSAPLLIKASSEVIVHLVGNSSLVDGELDPSAKTYEGASIKLKNSSKLTFCGDGVLNIDGSSKNGIKGGSKSSVIFNSGTININANNNAISVDDTIQLNGGNVNINCLGDGIKAVPDVEDTESLGNVIINGGNVNINCLGDGIQAESLLTINNGVIDIHTENGYESTTFDKDTMSAKGIKASGDRENIENSIIINGGTISLNTADDAIHSDSVAKINKGKITIYSKDDAIHADKMLELGSQNGNTRDPDVYIYSSYEGLESKKLYGYSGRFYIIAQDDGINTTDGGRHGIGVIPPVHINEVEVETSSVDYEKNAMYFYGGDYYISSEGDGIDSNGHLYFYGGHFSVFSAGGRTVESPFDSSGSWVIDGATLFGIGSNALGETPSPNSQKSITLDGKFNKDSIINVVDNGNVVCSQKNIKETKYIFYSSPSMTNNANIEIGGSLNECLSNDWAHDWSDGVINGSIVTYTCSKCGKVEHELLADDCNITCDGHVEEIGVLGDMDGNGLLDANDASIILDIFKSNNQTSQNIAMGDMDGNGVIDANDASQILELYKINK